MISGYNRLLSAIQREKGYRQALLDSGIEFDPDLIKYGSYGFTGGLRSAKEILQMDDRPTAIFTISDITAIGAIKAIKQEGLRVPEDIAVVGFDNTGIAAMYDPPLTTVAQPRYDLGKISMEILLDLINNKNIVNKEIYLEHELIIRESTI